jgi:hypothetical protein
VKSIKDMSIGELAAFISSYLKRNGIDAILSGGSCVSIYSENKYASLDLDFIEFGSIGRRKLKKVLGEIGFFSGKDRHFKNSETDIFLEFPPGPLAVGQEPVKEIITLNFPTGKLRIISPTDCVKDRLAAYYHWGDQQALEQAILVAKDNTIDLDELERWSNGEGKLPIFQAIKNRLKE